MAYQVFKRRGWKDAKCTEPGIGRKTHVTWTASEEAAREACRRYNNDSEGNRIERPYGLAYEYEEVS